MHVLSGQAQFDDRRNSSMVRAPDPNVVPQFIASCRRARERGEEWIAWIDNGCPELTVAEYEAVKPKRQLRKR